MTPELQALLNHLWQSTAFAGAAAALAWLVRNQAARVRFHIWLAASLKFLVPFSTLTAVGTYIGTRTVPVKAGVPEFLSIVIEDVGRPFAQAAAPPAGAFPLAQLAIAIWVVGVLAVVATWSLRWIRMLAVLRRATVLASGREFDALRRMEQRCGMRAPLRLLESDTATEPGIAGIFRPALLLPAGIGPRLSDDHLAAILAHELCHVRRRDNLAALFHMAVEALFWFHPLVWWMGARLVEAREHACDEEVLHLGSEPEVYAEGILKVCQYYVESPLVCASGVTGSDLKRRIEGIMTRCVHPRPGPWLRTALAAVAMIVLATPILFGFVKAPVIPVPHHPEGMTTVKKKLFAAPLALGLALSAQEPPPRPLPPPSQAAPAAAGTPAPKEFEVASIKPGDPNDRRTRLMLSPGHLSAQNASVMLLLQQAYDVREFQIVGAPGWTESERFTIEAKFEGQPSREAIGTMMRALLADRFQLKLRRETKELPVYNLVVAKGGPKMKASPAPPAGGPAGPGGPGGPAGPGGRGMIRMGRGSIVGESMQMEMLANQLSRPLRRTIIDKTGLTGPYEVKLEWTPDENEGGPRELNSDAAAPVDSSGPTVFSALQEQLGLKLESSKGPVEILIIESIQKPTEN